MKTTSLKPLPCPFCGGRACIKRYGKSLPEVKKPYWAVCCRPSNGCSGSYPMVVGDTREEAVDNWNYRDGWPQTTFVGSDKRHLQPIMFDEHDVARFVENKIVRLLLETGKYDMNKLAMMQFSDADRQQFAQLIGYSVCGFGELSYADWNAVRAADAAVARMLAVREAVKGGKP